MFVDDLDLTEESRQDGKQVFEKCALELKGLKVNMEKQS